MIRQTPTNTTDGRTERHGAPNLHITNDQRMYEDVLANAFDVMLAVREEFWNENTLVHNVYASEALALDSRAPRILGDRLEEAFKILRDDLVDGRLKAQDRSMLADIGSLWRVEWVDVARGFIETALEVEEEEVEED